MNKNIENQTDTIDLFLLKTGAWKILHLSYNTNTNIHLVHIQWQH